MIKKDPKIALQYVPGHQGWIFNWEESYKITGLPINKEASPSTLTAAEYKKLVKMQRSKPVLITTMCDKSKCLWWFKDAFYWDNEGHSANEMEILLSDRLYKEKRKLERAEANLKQQEFQPRRSRKGIQDDVKIFVWQRDSGQCVKCGSNKLLEFDHIIPLCKGGSNSARNLQLLCEKCNRAKGGDL